MKRVETVDAVREQIARWRRRELSVAFVPTMGNLHDGHIALIRHARDRCDRVVASSFVNPLQFAPDEDFDSYPRTLEQDIERLIEEQTELLFTPDVDTMYPQSQTGATLVSVPHLSGILCGAHRPGHFDGVTTVVAKLFQIVQPDVAVFGEKDYQQLTLIRRMVADLCMPIEIDGVATQREADGLAMSSRNGNLSEEERAIAPRLFQSLRAAADRLSGGEDIADIEAAGVNALREAGFRPAYFEVCDAANLSEPNDETAEYVILAAAHLGRTRLIDNIRVNRGVGE